MSKSKKEKAPKPAAKKTKKEILIGLLKKGSTLAEMTKAVGWAKEQSVRGAISTIGFVSEKAEGQDRVFHLKARRAK